MTRTRFGVSPFIATDKPQVSQQRGQLVLISTRATPSNSLFEERAGDRVIALSPGERTRRVQRLCAQERIRYRMGERFAQPVPTLPPVAADVPEPVAGDTEAQAECTRPGVL